MFKSALLNRTIIDEIISEEIDSKNEYKFLSISEKQWAAAFILNDSLKPFYDANKELKSCNISTINILISIYT